MGLLRNASGLIIPSVIHPNLRGRADDPEFHISRLQHFGKGMGIDLTSVHPQHPQFSNKELISTGDSENDYLDFNSHDEGLQLPIGHILAANTATSRATDYDPGVLLRAYNEIDHRAPYQHRVNAGLPETPDEDFSISEDISKHIADGESRTYLKSSWNVPRRHRTQGYNPNFDTHEDSMKDVRSRFNEFNRNRQGRSSDVSDLVSRSINNPDLNRMSIFRRLDPHMLSPQFLSVRHSENDNLDTDHIDLETGNWAKIEPEGYFPD